MTRLWDKGHDIDALVHKFTVGDDPLWDRHLVHWDCLGSAAHARTLERAELLTRDEASALVRELRDIDALDQAGEFLIPTELEDCHTAIETHLTQALGEVGGKIHTGRSRNDQVATAMRLFMRRRALQMLRRQASFAQAVMARARRDGDMPMPGYTHMQPAMPSSIGLWLNAFAEAGLEQIRAAIDLLNRLDCCPLGTGAGFGVSLPLDREYTARLLGFSRAQRSPIDVQNSRGRMETYFVRVAVDTAAFVEKLAWDMLLYTTEEFHFFSLPEELTTGSSIMPQKRNPDVLELLRGRTGVLRGRLAALEWVAAKLPSNYHRDLQLTKEPAIRAAFEIDEMLTVALRVVETFTINADSIAAGMRNELHAVDAALALVATGMPFRLAYREIAAELRGGTFSPTTINAATGKVHQAVLEAGEAELQSLTREVDRRDEWVRAAESALFDD